MLETFIALFLSFTKIQKNISEHENPFENKFKHLFEAKFGRAPKISKLIAVREALGPAVSQLAHRGAGRTLGSADPTWQRLPATFFQ